MSARASADRGSGRERGRAAPATLGWYDGSLADVALYPYALNEEQVARHFALRQETAAGGTTLTYTIEANASGAVRSGKLTVASVPIPVSQAAAGGVSPVGGLTPSPNAAGWNHTPVTVVFTCAGEGTVTHQASRQTTSARRRMRPGT